MIDEAKLRDIFRRNLNRLFAESGRQKKELAAFVGVNDNRLFAESGRQKKELAAFVGVNDNTVTSWVSGRKVPRMDKIDRICAFFHAQRKDLILPEVPPAEAALSLTEAERALVRKYRALDERGQAAVGAVLESEGRFCEGPPPED